MMNVREPRPTDPNPDRIATEPPESLPVLPVPVGRGVVLDGGGVEDGGAVVTLPPTVLTGVHCDVGGAGCGGGVAGSPWWKVELP